MSLPEPEITRLPFIVERSELISGDWQYRGRCTAHPTYSTGWNADGDTPENLSLTLDQLEDHTADHHPEIPATPVR